MGDFTVEVKAVGGHGCQREVKDGGTMKDCGQPGCPDCIARRFVADLKAHGCSVNSATIVHWPGQPATVKDDLLTETRTGSF
jgi:hypothetical protein